MTKYHKSKWLFSGIPYSIQCKIVIVFLSRNVCWIANKWFGTNSPINSRIGWARNEDDFVCVGSSTKKLEQTVQPTQEFDEIEDEDDLVCGGS